MADAPSPYGDGRAAERIADFIAALAGQQPARPERSRRQKAAV
jgi:UDP-N-acetylglucosamine 2-epimerase